MDPELSHPYALATPGWNSPVPLSLSVANKVYDSTTNPVTGYLDRSRRALGAVAGPRRSHVSGDVRGKGVKE